MLHTIFGLIKDVLYFGGLFLTFCIVNFIFELASGTFGFHKNANEDDRKRKIQLIEQSKRDEFNREYEEINLLYPTASVAGKSKLDSQSKRIDQISTK